MKKRGNSSRSRPSASRHRIVVGKAQDEGDDDRRQDEDEIEQRTTGRRTDSLRAPGPARRSDVWRMTAPCIAKHSGASGKTAAWSGARRGSRNESPTRRRVDFCYFAFCWAARRLKDSFSSWSARLTPSGDRDLVRHHRHVVAHENLLDLLEIRRRGHGQSCAAEFDSRALRSAGRRERPASRPPISRPGTPPPSFALLLLGFLAGQRADELLGELRIFRRLRHPVAAEPDHRIVIHLRRHIGDVHVELRLLGVLDDPVAARDHRDLASHELVVHRVLAGDRRHLVHVDQIVQELQRLGDLGVQHVGRRPVRVERRRAVGQEPGLDEEILVRHFVAVLGHVARGVALRSVSWRLRGIGPRSSPSDSQPRPP